MIPTMAGARHLVETSYAMASLYKTVGCASRLSRATTWDWFKYQIRMMSAHGSDAAGYHFGGLRGYLGGSRA